MHQNTDKQLYAMSQNLGSNSSQALDLAYLDVKEAFRYWQNHSEDKPFFLASHSQGSLHAQRLLTEKEFKAVFKATHRIFNWISSRGTISQNLAASVCTRFLDEGIIIQFNQWGKCYQVKIKILDV